jgi:putative RNA 2'-phosphotransferase
MADLVRLSRLLAVMLRHKPDQFGLRLDSQGFTDTDAVWRQVTKRYPRQYQYKDLLAVVQGDQQGKKRYEIQGSRIRALYGHSVSQTIQYEPATPPETLYHGTTHTALAAIRQQGLTSQNRQYVHLTINLERAENTAKRHRGQPIILVIRAGAAYQAGIRFYHPEPEHFLALAIPPAYIDFSEDEE